MVLNAHENQTSRLSPITLDPTTPPPLVCQAGLEITAPGSDTTLMISPDPTMPPLEAMARITGVEPDPTNQTDFTWVITVSYTTRQTRPRTLSEPFTARAWGGQLPQDIWGASIVGGNITMQALAQVVVEGDLASVSDIVEGPVLRGENPPKAAIQQRLDNGDAEQTTWLRKIACQERGQRQFATMLNPSLFRYPGEPLMNSSGDGGAGIMQITKTDRLPEGPRLAELWDWRANVDEGKRVFADKLAGAQAYPGQVRRNGNFMNMVEVTNQWRQQQGLPPLDQVLVPDFGWYNVVEPDGSRIKRNLLVEDAVRGYNGWHPPIGQFGMETHEFRLKTNEVVLDGSTVTIFAVENERTMEGNYVADAIWIRVPPNERRINKTYVNDVRNQDPTCP